MMAISVVGKDLNRETIGKLKSEVVEITGNLPEYIVMTNSQYDVAMDEKDTNISRKKKGRLIKYRGLAPVVIPDAQAS